MSWQKFGNENRTALGSTDSNSLQSSTENDNCFEWRSYCCERGKTSLHSKWRWMKFYRNSCKCFRNRVVSSYISITWRKCRWKASPLAYQVSPVSHFALETFFTYLPLPRNNFKIRNLSAIRNSNLRFKFWFGRSMAYWKDLGGALTGHTKLLRFCCSKSMWVKPTYLTRTL